MDTPHPRRLWTDFDDLREPPGAGGGIMLAEPFDTLLRWILRREVFASAPAPADGPWIQVDQAIDQQDQHQLDAALAEARNQYSPIGYRMMVRGYAAHLAVGGRPGLLQLPEVPE